jgi:hypothetical protein
MCVGKYPGSPLVKKALSINSRTQLQNFKFSSRSKVPGTVRSAAIALALDRAHLSELN